MFNNPGKKLKTLAIIIFVLLCLIPVIAGLLIMFNVFPIFQEASQAIIVRMLIIIFGILIAWLSSIMLYTIGAMADDIQTIRKVQTYFYHKQRESEERNPVKY